jgi:hypothetical protein
VLFGNKEEWNYVICRKMDGAGEHQAEQDMPSSERQTLDIFIHMPSLDPKQ